MNVFGKRERSWRKAHKRGVSPIIATILLVAITVVLAAVLYVLISGLTKGPGSTPIGSAFGFGTAQQTSGAPTGWTCPAAPVTCYSIGIASSSSSVTTASVSFALQSGGVATAFTNVTLVGLTGTALATFNPVTGVWHVWAGSTPPVTLASTDTLYLISPASAAGDSLIAAGTGSLQGTTSTTLP